MYAILIPRRHRSFFIVHSATMSFDDLGQHSSSLRFLDSAPVTQEKRSELPQSLEWPDLMWISEPHNEGATRVYLDTGLMVTQLNEGLHQPSFSAHSIELSPLCNEISRGVHLRDVAFVHHNHSAKQQRHDYVQPPISQITTGSKSAASAEAKARLRGYAQSNIARLAWLKLTICFRGTEENCLVSNVSQTMKNSYCSLPESEMIPFI